MTSRPLRPGSAASSPEWHSAFSEHTHDQLMSLFRAGAIALVLLGVLALIVLM
ncbi:hypothetical protein [Mycobacterium sp. OTB74]|uniref:hypothetical protein n=1 Tax=Mycobacterium sp. OTB74 TaxID=1853452 RepID=UPI002473D110|nr:hypothetical protein [Mycobacterium sp. OTB74]